ncbi:MAG: hypothetical protein JNL96_09630 [Planctomycetaceae bacterium]|nr:hypothetical protein [Planctomycetaceae bacterium]
MTGFWTGIDDLLRLRGWAAAAAASPRSTRKLGAYAVLFGFTYGAAMGSFGLFDAARPAGQLLLQMTYSAVKVPLLLGATCLVALPSFFVINSLLGLRDDFRLALRAVVATQAGVAVTLAALAPLTVTWYASSDAYVPAVLFNAAMFAAASGSAQVLLRGHYRALVARNPRHRSMMWTWLGLYAFVGIEMGWMLRPFIGSRDVPVEFFRREPLDNAYVVVARIVGELLR